MAWYNSSWQYRVKVTVLASKVDADLTDYPVYVNLANPPAGFHSHVKSDGGDIRVTKADGTTEVPREVVFYDSATDTGELHFKASGTLSGTTDTDFYIYYGNASASDYAATDTYGRNNVWTNGYKAVYHLDTGASGEVDSTSNSIDLTETGTVNEETSTTKIGNCRSSSTNGSNYLSATNPSGIDGISKITLQGWIRDTQNDANPRGIISKRVAYNNNNSYGVFLYTGRFLNFDNGNSTGTNYDTRTASATSLTYNTWYMFHCVFDGTLTSTERKKIYLQGALDKTDSASMTTIYDSNSDLYAFILNSSYSYSWLGQIDELRISSDARSSTWISTEYNNQSSPSTFYSVGSEETAGVVANDSRSARVKGFSVTNSNRNARIKGFSPTGLPTPDNLKTLDYAHQAQPFVDVPAKSSVDVKTMDYAYKGQPFVRNYATGATSISENRNARIKGFDTTSNFRSTRIKGESTVNDNRSSRIKGVGTSFDQKDARIIGKDIAISDRSAKTTGTEIINSLRSSRIKGVDTVFDSKSARIIGYLSTSESRNTRVIGKEIVSDNRNAKTKGVDTVFSSRNARIVGSLMANDNRNARILGEDIENSSRGSRINGVDTTSSNRSARVIGLEIAQDSRNSFIKGVSGASDSRDTRIKGSERTSDTRVARIKGLEVITDGREAKIFGRETANDSRSARVKGFFTTENNRNARIKGFDTLGNSRNAKIYGIYIVQDSRSARTKGYEMVHWTPEKRIPVGVEAPVSHSQTIEWTPEKRLPVGTEAPVLHSQTVEWEPEKKVPSGRSN